MYLSKLKISLGVCLFLQSTYAVAANLELSNTPLYLGGSVAPNIMFIIDDSGSMMLEVTPDDLALNGTTTYGGFVFPRADNVYGDSDYADNFIQTTDPRTDQAYAAMTRSAQFNTTYYNPAVTYTPWVRSDGSLYPNASASCALHNPEQTGNCPGNGDVNSIARNLTVTNGRYNNNYWRACYDDGDCASGFFNNFTFWPATYYTYNGGDRWNIDNYDRIEIRSSINSYSGDGRIARDDCNLGTCTYAQEIQNFANWYTYYRSRILAARAGIGKAFSLQGINSRIGFGAINKSSSDIDGENTATIVSGIRSFAGDDRDNFFDQLYTRDIPALGTPLRKALDDAGQYFSRDGDEGPWSDTPGESGGEQQICRQNYSILMTDGYWSGGNDFDASTNAARNNVDGSSGNTITSPDGETFQYTPESPFSDSYSNTLADVAMYYWNRDLRTDLDNVVSTSPLNEAFWQHMVTFGIGFGVSGSVDKEEAFAAINNNDTINWPNTSPNSTNCSGSECAARLDDLLHAAVNSRGDFFNAADAKTFADSLTDILSNIADRTSSASSVALNSGTVADNSRIYQARFDSGDWSGQLLAFNVESDGQLGSIAWDASDNIPNPGQRIIVTSDGSDGQRFRWNALNNTQQAQLGNNQAVLSYIRGNASNETVNGGTFRSRSNRLGDIINSAPAYLGAPSSRYRDNWGNGAAENASPYSQFRADYLDRDPLIFVGANDGMLHAFNAGSGREEFAYIPNAVLPRLNELTDPNYNHKYFVDGSPTIVDAFINGAWRSVLVSGLNGGGQGVFALDVTNPGDFDTEASAADQVLWEFTDRDDEDLGFTYGDPSIVRLQNGVWAALFSGGYNNTFDNDGDGADNDSSDGDAVLYLVNLANGNLIARFDTKTGAAEDPTGASRPNGLGTPSAVDINGDQVADFIYAGDLFGNMWKIDISAGNANSWDFAYKQGNNPLPIFTACADNNCNAGNVQPITSRPVVVNHPTSSGYQVLFGTGKYFEVGDNSRNNQVTQSFYGIWDRNANTLDAFDRSDLLQQTILFEQEESGFEYRVTSDNQINWTANSGWYMDLISPATATNQGERQVSEAVVRNGRVIFTTLLPSDDPCGDGGDSWIMELNFNSGSRLDYTPFDVNGDGVFNSGDLLNVGDIDGDGEDDFVPVSGRKSKVGITSTPSIMGDGSGQSEFKYMSGSDGNIEVITENPGPGFEGRQSWRQLEFIFR